MEKLLTIMRELRMKCPWDQAQTPESLTRYAIEEAYEVEEAIRQGDVQHIKEELGDLLLQVVFQAQMFSERGAFDFNDVVEAISEKMIRRHPHVFESEKYAQYTTEQVSELWQQIKKQEKQDKTQSRLSEVKHAPALIQAEEIQKNVACIGFDFENTEDAMQKVFEELDEFNEAISNQNSDEMLDEFGDCLFSFINVGRKLGISSEMALLSTIHKFKSRFYLIEAYAQKNNKLLDQLSLEEMNDAWEQAKVVLKQQKEKEILHGYQSSTTFP